MSRPVDVLSLTPITLELGVAENIALTETMSVSNQFITRSPTQLDPLQTRPILYSRTI